jgi:DNA-binding CsgD family transcriptional regulator
VYRSSRRPHATATLDLRAFAKLGVNDRTAAVTKALSSGGLDP